ncbi:MAG: amidohydrolase [Candidatus Marinimicrobia bacterium]|nr:amidohydrolase [Candidatus Neomarinimicrobiota bacterium]
MSILIKNIVIGKEVKDLLIEGHLIKKIGYNIFASAEKIIDGSGKIAFPGFFNTHTHAAMTLLRGYSDDLPVLQWLQEKIWPFEAKLTEEDVYIGTKLACLEMIKTGTVFFNDMYWHFDGIVRAVTEMGIRAVVNSVVIDFNNPDNFKQQVPRILEEYEKSKDFPDTIQYAIGAHSIYVVSEYALGWIADFAQKHDITLHIHLSETEHEVDECMKFRNMRPVEYLDSTGFLENNVISAHSIWLDDHEIEILKKHKTTIAHIPTSNMKLSSGIFQYKKFTDYMEHVTIGTDGCASNNNLDMGEEMKFASCKAKMESKDPTMMDAETALKIATENGANAFGINGGKIEEGKLADLVLVNLNHHLMIPAHHHISNYVYSANSSVIDTTICNGKILMEDRTVPGEIEILKEAKDCIKNLLQK